MRDELLQVMALQCEFSARNTPAMQRRGRFVRDVLPDQLRRIADDLRAALGPYGEDLRFQGRDGTGLKTIIPWVRFYSHSRSRSAQNGWYCVYLFDAAGGGVYLALAHGSTTFEDGDFRPKPAEQLANLVAWARRVLAVSVAEDPSLARAMDLGGQVLGDAYERSTALAKWYPASEMPDDDRLHADAVRFADFLRAVYEAEDLGRAPGSVPPEVAEVVATAAGAPQRRRTGQGFGLIAAQRQAVEQRAMAVARAYLEGRHWRVTDVSAQESFDFLCRRRDEEMIVEVKGTTSAGEQVSR